MSYMEGKRTATIARETTETRIALSIAIDGTGRYDVDTGIHMLDHLLEQFARHGLFDMTVRAESHRDIDHHHAVEDVAICLGQALGRALGEGKGIARMGHAIVPMDEALAMVAVDMSGRGYAVLDAPFKRKKVGDMESDLVRHFLETMAREARATIHVRLLSGSNEHHKAEAIFKALGRALDAATRLDERIRGDVPSTKGVIEGGQP